MNFEIRPTDKFWRGFRELSVAVQEEVLDALEGMRIDPGSQIDREHSLPIRVACTRARIVETEGRQICFSIVFQYDSDEVTVHINDLLITDEPI